ncbi:MAG TPA: hypothetical protein VFQ43_21000, partial [Nitrososphaera sp.]|nr:hypothetical protein [Nitrososphaera sp.]
QVTLSTLSPSRPELCCRVAIAAPLHEGTESWLRGLFYWRMANGTRLAVCLFPAYRQSRMTIPSITGGTKCAQSHNR